MPFSVITSKKAQQDYLNIKSRHADILTGMTNQKMRVDQYNQQKDQQKMAMDQNQATMQAEMDKEKMAQGTIQQKNTMDFQQKQQELELKKIALSQP